MNNNLEVSNDHGDGFSTPPMNEMDMYLIVFCTFLGMISVPLSLYLTMK